MLKILLSNDDGVSAPGIAALQSQLNSKFELTTVAPLEERSTTGHSLSLDKPLRVEKIDSNIFGCSGFPGDCILVALGHVLKNNRPDVVVSGINRGANLGQDLYYSGTVAAAREAAFHQVPSIAVSLVLKSVLGVSYYQSAAQIVQKLLEAEVYRYISPYTLLNLNVPNLPIDEIKGIKITQVGFRNYSEEVNERIDARGRPYYWIVGLYQGFYENQNSDCAAVEDGFASITVHQLVGHSKSEETQLKRIVEEINAKYF